MVSTPAVWSAWHPQCRRLPPVTVPGHNHDNWTGGRTRNFADISKLTLTGTKNKLLPHVLSCFYVLSTITISLLKIRSGSSNQVVEVC